MRGALRTIACYLLVASILGGLWTYAVLQQHIGHGERRAIPGADPSLMRHARELAEEEDRKEHKQQRAAADQNVGAVTQLENGR
jgi:hypothetical protein